MKHFFSALLLLFFGWSFSQSTWFIYEMKYKPDSATAKQETLDMVLELKGDRVQYFDWNAIRTDSLNKNQQGYHYYTSGLTNLKRKAGSQENEDFYFLDQDYFKFPTKDPIDWQLTNESGSNGKWTLQKATTTFGGRKWEAWFTTEIPLSEGPYKFVGLPGLIVELSDEGGNYHFQLLRVEKNEKELDVETIFKKKPIAVSEERFGKLLMAYYNDPYASYRSMQPGSWAIGTEDGGWVETVDGLNQLTKEMQEKIRRQNNPIELDKAPAYK